jgi:hypothetical protein
MDFQNKLESYTRSHGGVDVVRNEVMRYHDKHRQRYIGRADPKYFRRFNEQCIDSSVFDFCWESLGLVYFHGVDEFDDAMRNVMNGIAGFRSDPGALIRNMAMSNTKFDTLREYVDSFSEYLWMDSYVKGEHPYLSPAECLNRDLDNALVKAAYACGMKEVPTVQDYKTMVLTPVIERGGSRLNVLGDKL